ncbi:MAG: NAD(+) diphosphatase [Propionibacteriaceae bacterium]|nr:NAD(+) diphosphatase [Propionibacteriaceae bacterium]
MDWSTTARLERPLRAQSDPEWVAGLWQRDDARLLPVTTRGRVGFRAPGELAFVRPEGGFEPGRDVFVGLVADAPVFAQIVIEDDALRALVGDGVVTAALRTGMDDVDDGLDVAFAAAALAQWHGRAAFCPACGHRTRVIHAGQARHCDTCDADLFCRTDPAVIMAVLDDADRLLLGRQRVWASRHVSVFAGYLEAGESAEQAVRRELAEEVGLRDLRDLRYLGSQPWPFPRSLMLGFTVRTSTSGVRVDGDEIEAARWFTRAQLRTALDAGEVTLPSRCSIAHRMITTWLRG